MDTADADAWVLLACKLTRAQDGAEDAQAWLCFLEVADFLNHAIPTAAELEGAFDRLGRMGLLARAAGLPSVTVAGRRLIEDCDSRSVHRVLRSLAARLRVGGESTDAEPVPFAAAAYQTALENRRRF